ncbi:hypothetical protein [Bifidobacterium simiarum]|nr:hypothetical protein [Bifidobacterium simiarum]MBT1167260.1 hypothetical protein [Bifidobacterium simiarum]
MLLEILICMTVFGALGTAVWIIERLGDLIADIADIIARRRARQARR